jgi:hypothetical protein
MSRSPLAFKALRRELKRRKVAHTCIFYILACWGVVQVVEVGFSLLGVDPAGWSPFLIGAAFGGFPIALLFSWFYQVSQKGVTRRPSFVDRRVLDNLSPLDDRRDELPSRGNPSRHESAYDWILEIESGPLVGQRHGIDNDILVGRSPDCDLTVPIAQISREHARFLLEENRLRIEDLGSANGTKINGSRVDGSVSLHHQDKIEVLNLTIRVQKNFAHAHAQDATDIRTTTKK